MPCNADYLEPTESEKEASKVAWLLQELTTKLPVDPEDYARGMHPDIYGREFNIDVMVSTLCAALRNEDVTKYSLEMQMWWRDHKKADEARLAAALAAASRDKAIAAALAKLTFDERKLLGL